MKTFQFLCFAILCSVVSVHSYRRRSFRSLNELLNGEVFHSTPSVNFNLDASSIPVYIGPQDGLKEADMIQSLPRQPIGVDFNQFSGYFTVDPIKGRALFYYFAESPRNSSTKPLVLWLNGGRGCSSLGGGAMMELGPFRVSRDGETLYRNQYAWNNEANIIFLESPAGVGFSYSNTTSDYDLSGDNTTAIDSYCFLRNWLERFPEYKTRNFYITGESYAGHYVPQLAQMIHHMNKNTNQTSINLKGIAIGNAYVDYESNMKGSADYIWSHALISDETYMGLISNCNFSAPNNSSPKCFEYKEQENCSDMVYDKWKDKPLTTLPIIKDLMETGIDVWIYSGDTDRVVPVTSTRYSIDKLGTPVKSAWYPWNIEGEVGGYAVRYQNLTFATVRGSGHFVPSYQPARALTLFSSFINGQLPSPSWTIRSPNLKDRNKENT